METAPREVGQIAMGEDTCRLQTGNLNNIVYTLIRVAFIFVAN